EAETHRGRKTGTPTAVTGRFHLFPFMVSIHFLISLGLCIESDLFPTIFFHCRGFSCKPGFPGLAKKARFGYLGTGRMPLSRRLRRLSCSSKTKRPSSMRLPKGINSKYRITSIASPHHGQHSTGTSPSTGARVACGQNRYRHDSHFEDGGQS